VLHNIPSAHLSSRKNRKKLDEHRKSRRKQDVIHNSLQIFSYM